MVKTKIYTSANIIKTMKNSAEYYVIGEKGIGKLEGNRIENMSSDNLPNLTRKQVSLRSQGLAIADSEGNLIEFLRKKYAQHSYPLSIKDYAKVAYQNVRSGKDMPILSIDSHDTLNCDFACQDCLSGAGRNIPAKCSDYNFNLPFAFSITLSPILPHGQ